MDMKSAIYTATVALSIASSLFARAQVPIPDVANTIDVIVDQVHLVAAKQIILRETGVLYVFTAAVSGTKAWLPAACQPLKGEQVKLIAFMANAGGVRGVNAAHVKVAEGRCRGSDGWVGTAFLNAFP